MRFGNSSCPSIPGPDLAQVELVELGGVDDDRALRIADRDMLELPFAAAALSLPLAVLAAPRGSPSRGRRPSHLDAQVSSPVIVGTIGPATVPIAKVVLVGPAVATQVEDRLARAVAGELGFRSVGVEDPQVGDEPGIVAAREQQNAVRADAEMRVAEPLDPRLRLSSHGSRSPPRGSDSRSPAPATSRISRRQPICPARRGSRRRPPDRRARRGRSGEVRGSCASR